jgi:hypothetical protein
MSKLACWTPTLFSLALVSFATACAGCRPVPSAHTISRNYSLGDAPIDPPSVHNASYEHCLTGGRVFKMYCASCHNARALGERPFASYEVAVAHMREQAYLTGTEYRALIHFLRRWHDVGPPTSEVEPGSKRLVFSQPITELRPGTQRAEAEPGAEETASEEE